MEINFATYYAAGSAFHFAESICYFIACGKPGGHREVAPRQVDVHARWKPETEVEDKRRRKKTKKRKRKKIEKKKKKKKKKRKEQK